jgi:hypothetical protein
MSKLYRSLALAVALALPFGAGCAKNDARRANETRGWREGVGAYLDETSEAREKYAGEFPLLKDNEGTMRGKLKEIDDIYSPPKNPEEKEVKKKEQKESDF